MEEGWYSAEMTTGLSSYLLHRTSKNLSRATSFSLLLARRTSG
jgi:hypothetical protein